jgi:CheY-like chemotaxis protein/HPt (histidine-containing phosphotransfer) domain-containing protein
VEKPEEKTVIVYERREIYANSIIVSVDNLGVGCELVMNDSELKEKISSRTFAYLFISFALYERNKKVISKSIPNTKVVVLTEFGEVIPDKNLRVLAMPVYSISIANILNGVSESFRFNENDAEVARFIAPDAKILVVDDINTNLKVAEGLMLPYKMQVDLCKGGREAIEAVIFKRYDLIFMDHKMPDMDGLEATLYIRKMGEDDPYFRNVPIVALTANAVAGTRDFFLNSGFNDFLSKPIDTIKLNTILEKWIPKKMRESVAYEGNLAQRDAEPETWRRDIKIDGVDIESGVYFSGGKMEGYLEILKIYHKDGFEKIREIETSLESGDLGLYTVHVHALKSASANIGANALSEMAKELETAGERKDLDFINSATPKVLTELELLLKRITDALGIDEEIAVVEEGPFNIELIKDELFNLKKAIEILDAGTINRTIEKLKKNAQPGKAGASIGNISEKLLFGDYDEAAALVDKLLGE